MRQNMENEWISREVPQDMLQESSKYRKETVFENFRFNKPTRRESVTTMTTETAHGLNEDPTPKYYG